MRSGDPTGQVHGSKQLIQQRGLFFIAVFYYALAEINWLTITEQHSLLHVDVL
jgi:hypothetical protein